jgi:hypothetical protein
MTSNKINAKNQEILLLILLISVLLFWDWLWKIVLLTKIPTEKQWYIEMKKIQWDLFSKSLPSSVGL